MIGWLVFAMIIVLIIAYKSIKIVNQEEVVIIERLGKYHKTISSGLHWINPFIDRKRATVDLREQIMDVPPQKVITKDNVSIGIDTVVFYQITEPERAVYKIQNLRVAISTLTTTTMRDIIGKMDLDSTFSSRAQINEQLSAILDEGTDKWGCKVNKVEIKDIEPSRDVKDAMEKQMNAERNKRATILDAEGEKQAAITIAEGQKEARILDADASKEENIRRAEGVRQAKILEATGEAEAIRSIAEAKANEIELVYGAIRNAQPDDKLIAIKTLESLEKVADGKANKVFIPFEATKALAGLGSLNEITKE